MSGTNNEKIFKLLGWKPIDHALYGIVGWETPKGKRVDETPLATGDWEVCREHIIPIMRKNGFDYFVSSRNPLESADGFIPQQLTWTYPRKGKPEWVNEEEWYSVEVRADNLPAALVAGAIKAIRAIKKEKKNAIR